MGVSSSLSSDICRIPENTIWLYSVPQLEHTPNLAFNTLLWCMFSGQFSQWIKPHDVHILSVMTPNSHVLLSLLSANTTHCFTSPECRRISFLRCYEDVALDAGEKSSNQRFANWVADWVHVILFIHKGYSSSYRHVMSCNVFIHIHNLFEQPTIYSTYIHRT